MREDTFLASCLNGTDDRTLIDVLRWRAQHQPEQQAYTFLIDGDVEGKSLTYEELDRKARTVAALLQKRLIQEERALLLYPSGLDYIVAFFGCLYAGITAVPIYPPSSNRSMLRIEAIQANAQARVVLTTQHILSKIRTWSIDPALAALEWIASDTGQSGNESAWQDVSASGETLAFLQYTSGSTGTPKGVMVSHRNLMHNLALMCRLWQLSDQSIGVSWLPIFHDLGLIAGILQPLYTGFPAIIMSPAAFLQRPLRWLYALSRHGGTVSYAPNFAYDLCIRRVTPEDLTQLDLSTWRVALNGAEPVRSETLDHFAKTFASCGFQRKALVPAYGLAEGTLVVASKAEHDEPVVASYDRVHLAQHHVRRVDPHIPAAQPLVGHGLSGIDQRVIIAQPDTMTTCSPVEVGEVWVRGPSVTQGYWQRPEETAQTFQAFLSDTGEGPFLRTGDLGFIAHNELFITGRLKDLIILNGSNYYPQDIELTVQGSHKALRPDCGVAFSIDVANSERLVVVQEVHRECKDYAGICDVIRKAIALEHEIQAHAVVLIRHGSILKTSSGKIQRRACRAAFLAGTLTVVEQSISPQVGPSFEDEDLSDAALNDFNEASLVHIIARMLGIGPGHLDLHATLNALGCDSLMAGELKNKLETLWGVALPLTDLLHDTTVSSLAAQIREERARGASVFSSQAPARLEEQDYYHLSFAQEQLWFLHLLEPDNPFYTIPFALHLQGNLHIMALEQSLGMLLQRHETLRTTFVEVNSSPLQRIHPPSLHLSLTDFTALSSSENIQRAREQVMLEVQRPFYLLHELPLRVRLLRLTPREHVLILTIHHVVCDGRSMERLVQELSILYTAFCQGKVAALPELPIRYVDYATWQRQWLQDAVLEPHLAYWRQQLAQLPALHLPTDHPRPVLQNYHGAVQRFHLSQPVLHQLQMLSRREGVTLFMTLLTAFHVLLARYSGQEDIVVGIPIAQRTRTEVENLVGFFVNILVIRTTISEELSFQQVLKHVRQVCLDAYTHQDVPFRRLVEELRPERDSSRNPLFQVIFTLQHTPLEMFTLPELTIAPFEIAGTTAKFDLTCDVVQSTQGLTFTLEYNTSLFEATTITRMAKHFSALLHQVAIEPERHLLDISWVSTEEFRYLHPMKSAALAPLPDTCLHEVFEHHAKLTPHAIAVVFQDSALTYGELNHRANCLAHYLQKRGVGPDTLVGICMERSLELITGLLGILKAGGAYIPLDPAHPRERLSSILRDAHTELLLTQQALIEKVPTWEIQVVYLDTDWPLIAREPRWTPEHATTTANLAYVIYTSGSTGTPKGVMVTHANVLRLLTSTQDFFGFHHQDTWVLFHSYAFDFSVWELWGALFYGGKLVVVSYTTSRSPGIFHDTLITENVTVLNQTPSAFRQLAQLEETEQVKPSALRWIIFGGEALDFNIVASWFQRYGDKKPQLVNMYGITETTVHTTFHLLSWQDVERERGSIIGVPLPDLQVSILDRYQRPVPIGVPGEIYMSGAGLARGYLGRGDLTAERFLPHPWAPVPGERLYRTGDAALYNEDRTIKYIGRLDKQVKIRGYRIELGEIETLLNQHPDIKECLVTVSDDTHGNASQDKQIVAYIVLYEQEDLPQKAIHQRLRQYLRLHVPEYMVPARFLLLSALPLTPNGKIDIRALPVPDHYTSDWSETSAGPQTPLEELLTNIWVELLGRNSLSIHDNFFEHGGHSLLATQMISQIRTCLQIEIPLRALFDAPTIARLAAYISTSMENIQGRVKTPIKPVPRDKELPLSFAQQRLWFLYRLMPGDTSYNMTKPLHIAGTVNVEALERTLREIIRRHEALRTAIVENNGQITQVVKPVPLLVLPVIDLELLPAHERTKESSRLLRDDAHIYFDLTQGVPVRVHLLRLSKQEHIFSFVTHHIAFDAWSEDIFMRELNQIYAAFSRGQSSPLAELPVQYADFAVWQREWLQGRVRKELVSYWRKQLSGAQALTLSADKPEQQSRQGAVQNFSLPRPLVEGLILLSRREQVTLFMTLLAAFQILLYRITGQEDVVIGTDIAHRISSEIEQLIGFFVNLLVLRTQITGDLSFKEILQRVRETVLNAYAHQDLPFEQLVDALHLERLVNQVPLVNVLFVFQHVSNFSIRMPSIEITPMDRKVHSAKFDLAIFLWETAPGEELPGAVNYDCSLFEADTISRLVDHFKIVLQNVSENPDIPIKQLDISHNGTRDIENTDQVKRSAVQRQRLKTIRRHEIVVQQQAATRTPEIR